LFLAAQEDHLDVVRYLVKELGADVHQADAEGCTPLNVAAQKEHVNVVQYLVDELDADVNRATEMSWAPFLMAAL
jgi:ankyrin repeat protein